MRLYSLTSSLHSEKQTPPCDELFIQELEAALGENFDFRDSFDEYDPDRKEIIYVRTGGTENRFKTLGLKGHISLLTSGESNSLAASMEILSYLHRTGQDGEILHGDPERIASALKSPQAGRRAGEHFIRTMPSTDLGGIRLGVIGKPSDWLHSDCCEFSGSGRLFPSFPLGQSPYYILRIAFLLT